MAAAREPAAGTARAEGSVTTIIQSRDKLLSAPAHHPHGTGCPGQEPEPSQDEGFSMSMQQAAWEGKGQPCCLPWQVGVGLHLPDFQELAVPLGDHTGACGRCLSLHQLHSAPVSGSRAGPGSPFPSRPPSLQVHQALTLP